MKRCAYCGQDNTDEAAARCECGTSFATPSTSDEEALWAPAPARRPKLAFILLAWGLALLAMLPFAALPFLGPFTILLMPAGLWGFFTEKEPKPWNLVAGWVFYAGVVTFLMKSKHRPLFVCLYLVLVVALILNVSGCYKMADAFGRDFH